MSLTKSDFAALEETVDIAVTKLDRRKTDQGWHLKKEVSLSVIISVIGVAVAGMTAYSDLKQDIALIQADSAVLHKSISSLHDADQETKESLKETVQRINIAIDKIDNKLDRALERNK